MENRMQPPVTVDNGAVTIARPFALLAFLGYTLLYFGLGISPFSLAWSHPARYGLGLGLAWDFVLFVVVTGIWLYIIADLRTTTIFTPGLDHALRRNLFYIPRRIPFARIGRIEPVTNAGTFGKGTAYLRIVDKNKPMGKGWQLTGNLRPDSPWPEFFVEQALPAINAMVFGDPAGPAPEQDEQDAAKGIPPENPKMYVKDGMVYARRRLGGIAILLLLLAVLALLVGIGAAWNGDLDGAGAAAMLTAGVLAYPVFKVSCIAFDVEKGELILFRLFGYWRRRVPLTGDFLIRSRRDYVNGVYYGTALLLQCPIVNTSWVSQLPIIRLYTSAQITLGLSFRCAAKFTALERESRHLLTASLVHAGKAGSSSAADTKIS